MTLDIDPEGAALPDPGSAGKTTTADDGDAPFGSLLLVGGDGSMISDNKEISQELLLPEEGCAGDNPKSCNCDSTTEKDHAAASPESHDSAMFARKYLAGMAFTDTGVSPALSAILASQRSDRDRDISMLSPQRTNFSRPAPNSDHSNKQELQPKRTRTFFSPTHYQHTMESPNNNNDANRSASSLESIGKISDRDLLSPILQSGNGENMRFSIGDFSRDGVDEETVFARESATSTLPNDAGPGDTVLNGCMDATIASNDLPDSAKLVLLRSDDAGDYVVAEDEEDAPPEPVSTPKSSNAESVLDVQESLRSPFPTIFEADEEEETESEPSIERGTQNESTEQQPNSTPAFGVTCEKAENFTESLHAVQTTFEHSVDPEPSSPFDTSLSPLKSIKSAESRRSLNLIERLRRNSFRRRMSISDPDSAPLSLPVEEHDSEKTTSVHADDAHFVALQSQNKVPMDTDVDGNADGLADTLASQDSLLAADFSSAVDVNDELALAGRSEQAQAKLQPGVESGQFHHELSYSTQNDDASSRRQGLGASSSMTFIEQLRGAALRRKMNLSRSRDSLAAKERKQRQDIAASEAARLEHEEHARLAAEALERRNKPKSVAAMIPTHAFKARPLPQTSGHLGSGGLAGVPKVAKKPTTTPMSPFLGPRRNLRKHAESVTATRIPEPSNEAIDLLTVDQSQFKARPLPKTTGAFGCAGQAGVPKVPKRQATVPFSPLLGPRRKTQPEKAVQIADRPKLDNIGVGQVRRSSSASQASLSSGQSLLGLEICHQKENNIRQVGVDVPPHHSEITAFVPRSTARAEKRAVFEAERKLKEQQRKEQQQRERHDKLKALRKELRELRMGI